MKKFIYKNLTISKINNNINFRKQMRKVFVVIFLFISFIVYGQRNPEYILNDTFNMFYQQFDQISENILNRRESLRIDNSRVIYYENDSEKHSININTNGIIIDVWSTFYTSELQPTIDMQINIFKILENLKNKSFIETSNINHSLYIYHPIYGTNVFSLKHVSNEIYIFCFKGISSYTFCISSNDFSHYDE